MIKIYSHCPKCGHAALPDDQALPAACPACGLILAKYAQIRADTREEKVAGHHAEPLGMANESNGFAGFLELIFYVPAQVETAAFQARIGLLVFFIIWGIRLIGMDFRDGELGSSFLHSPLLVFHEAGHVIFRLFGEFVTILGGTLGQLLMPVILMGALLLKNRDPYGASIGLWLLGVSFLDVAPYVYDALEPQLMLLSGTTGEEGGHDWIYLLNAMGLLKKAHGLGWFIHKLGAAIIVLSMAWSSAVLWRQYKTLTNPSQSLL